MSKKCLNGGSLLFPLLVTVFPLSVQATGLITVNQSGETVLWQLASTPFPVERVTLTINGPDQGAAALPAGCTAAPFICSLDFAAGNSPFITTTGFTAGSYNWETEIVPAVGEPVACGSQTLVRDSQGGNQGLSGGTVLSPEEQYIECLRAQGLLPPVGQELVESGNFTIATAGALVVPPTIPQPPTPGQADNIPPVAQCKDVTIENSGASCTATVDVNDGSFDPDGTLASIVQAPPAPYSLGVTSVALTVTDDLGATNSCAATVTVTDSQAPTIQCQTHSITPPDAPITFTASISDSCSTPQSQVVAYDCYRFNKKGKRIVTTDSCVVSIAGASVTIEETSGVASFIDWTVEATDSSGNQSSEVCSVAVTKPGRVK